MKITENIINDLIPLYLSDECSEDTKRAVTEYLAGHPEYAEKVRGISHASLPNDLTTKLNANDELKTLKRTQQLIRWKTYLMAGAIFFSLIPFSCLYTNERLYIFFIESPKTALAYGTVGIIFWITYGLNQRKLRQ